MNSQTCLRTAALSGVLAVAIGAFGAHGLKPLLDPYQLGIYEKGVQYQFYHTLALLALALLMRNKPDSKWLRRAAWLFLAGITLFSGSLYVLACRDLLPFSAAWAGPLTPLGGVCFIGGWTALLFSDLSR